MAKNAQRRKTHWHEKKMHLDFFFSTQVMYEPYFLFLHRPGALTMHKHTPLLLRHSKLLVLDYWPLSKSSRRLDQGDQSNQWHRWTQERLPNPVRRAWAQGLLLSGEGTALDLKMVRLIFSYIHVSQIGCWYLDTWPPALQRANTLYVKSFCTSLAVYDEDECDKRPPGPGGLVQSNLRLGNVKPTSGSAI